MNKQHCYSQRKVYPNVTFKLESILYTNEIKVSAVRKGFLFFLFIMSIMILIFPMCIIMRALLSKIISTSTIIIILQGKVWHEIPWCIQSFKKQNRNSGTSEAINPAANLEGLSAQYCLYLVSWQQRDLNCCYVQGHLTNGGLVVQGKKLKAMETKDVFSIF